jgi:predicted nuclease with TOPRIM domain
MAIPLPNINMRLFVNAYGELGINLVYGYEDGVSRETTAVLDAVAVQRLTSSTGISSHQDQQEAYRDIKERMKDIEDTVSSLVDATFKSQNEIKSLKDEIEVLQSCNTPTAINNDEMSSF